MSTKEQKHSEPKASTKRRQPKPVSDDLEAEAKRQNPLAIVEGLGLEPGSLTASHVLQLQHLIGNQLASRLLAQTSKHQPVQTEERNSSEPAHPTKITTKASLISPDRISRGIIQRVDIKPVSKEDEEKKSAVKTTLNSWLVDGIKKLEKEPRRADAHTGQKYVKGEINSMLSSFNTKWGSKDQYIVAEHQNEILAVMKLQEYGKIQLNHIVAKPHTDNETWPGNESPVSALMKWIASLGQGKKKTIQLNAEELSLIPLYRHFGYKMKDEKLEQDLKTFEQDNDLAKKDKDARKGLWEKKIKELEAMNIVLPEMVKN